VRDADLEQVKDRVSRIDRRLEEDVMTLAERLRNEGREQGRGEGSARPLIRQITLRFGAPDAAVRARIERADAATAARWADQMLTAPTLEDALR
jgi:hypothetical protein